MAAPLAVLLAARAANAAETALLAARNIYEQQVQVALFLREKYPGSSVALNDIGAVSYFADVRLFDLFGLGSNEVMQAKRGGYFHRDWIEQAGSRRRLDLAVVYDSWFTDFGGLPASWIKSRGMGDPRQRDLRLAGGGLLCDVAKRSRAARARPRRVLHPASRAGPLAPVESSLPQNA